MGVNDYVLSTCPLFFCERLAVILNHWTFDAGRSMFLKRVHGFQDPRGQL
jgi:hypothetical protein